MYEFVQDINFLWIGQATGNLYHLWLRVECTLFGYLQSQSNNVCNMRLHFVKGKVFIHIANGRFNFALIYSHLKSPREKVEIWMVFTNFLIFFHQLSWELLIDWNKMAIYQLSWNQNSFFRSGATYDLWQVDMMQFILKTGLFVVVIEHSVSKYQQERTISSKL